MRRLLSSVVMEGWLCRVVIEPQKLEKGGCIERLVLFTENMFYVNSRAVNVVNLLDHAIRLSHEICVVGL
jgi:hypothetical protein